MTKMEKLKENATDDQKADFTMAMLREVFDSNKWDYWVYCTNRLLSITYYFSSFNFIIEPMRIVIRMEEDGSEEIGKELENIISRCGFDVKYECIPPAPEPSSDPWTGEIIMITRQIWTYRFETALSVENRVDEDYKEMFSEKVEDWLEFLSDFFEVFNHERLEAQQASDMENE